MQNSDVTTPAVIASEREAIQYLKLAVASGLLRHKCLAMTSVGICFTAPINGILRIDTRYARGVRLARLSRMTCVWGGMTTRAVKRIAERCHFDRAKRVEKSYGQFYIDFSTRSQARLVEMTSSGYYYKFQFILILFRFL